MCTAEGRRRCMVCPNTCCGLASGSEEGAAPGALLLNHLKKKKAASSEAPSFSLAWPWRTLGERLKLS